jgi:hypothetical protein
MTTLPTAAPRPSAHSAVRAGCGTQQNRNVLQLRIARARSVMPTAEDARFQAESRAVAPSRPTRHTDVSSARPARRRTRCAIASGDGPKPLVTALRTCDHDRASGTACSVIARASVRRSTRIARRAHRG